MIIAKRPPCWLRVNDMSCCHGLKMSGSAYWHRLGIGGLGPLANFWGSLKDASGLPLGCIWEIREFHGYGHAPMLSTDPIPGMCLRPLPPAVPRPASLCCQASSWRTGANVMAPSASEERALSDAVGRETPVASWKLLFSKL